MYDFLLKFFRNWLILFIEGILKFPIINNEAFDKKNKICIFKSYNIYGKKMK